MIPCEQIEEIKELKKQCDIVEKTHIKLTVIQQQILKRQDNVDFKLNWLLGVFISGLITIVLFEVFGIGG